jgi:hypothetical protein
MRLISSVPSISAGHSGRPSRKPCARSQPRWASSSSCSGFSTPSATVGQTESVSDREDALHDSGLALKAQVGDEALVDLDARHREPLEVGEPRVPSPEVVDGDADPDGAKLVEDGLDPLVLDEDRLGELEDEQGRVEPGAAQDVAELVVESRLVELKR